MDISVVKEFLEKVENADLLKEPYRLDKAKQSAYMECLLELYKLKLEGKVEIVDADDFDKPHSIHAVQFNWIKDERGDWEIEAKRLINMLRHVDWVHVVDDPHMGEWQLSTTFYFPE